MGGFFHFPFAQKMQYSFPAAASPEYKKHANPSFMMYKYIGKLKQEY